MPGTAEPRPIDLHFSLKREKLLLDAIKKQVGDHSGRMTSAVVLVCPRLIA
jgi:hypothetical protein